MFFVLLTSVVMVPLSSPHIPVCSYERRPFHICWAHLLEQPTISLQVQSQALVVLWFYISISVHSWQTPKFPYRCWSFGDLHLLHRSITMWFWYMGVLGRETFSNDVCVCMRVNGKQSANAFTFLGCCYTPTTIFPFCFQIHILQLQCHKYHIQRGVSIIVTVM